MSHFSSIKTTITDLNILKAAAEQLGHQLEVGDNLYAHGYNGRRTKVDALIRGTVNKRGRFDIGFKKDKDSGTYTVVCDWWGAENEFGQSDVFTGQLTDAYCEQTVMATAKTRRWTLANRVEERVENEDYVVLTFNQVGDRIPSWQTRRW